MDELNSLIFQLRYDEALNKFYADEIVTVENEEPPTIGLAPYRICTKKYQENISNYSAELKNCIVSENISVCEWHYKFDHKKWGKWDLTQISVQRWKDGKIIHERHHYKTDKF